MYIREFLSFWNRRVKIPTNWEGLVLDIGSGDKPHWRADVLLDNFPEAEYGIQRGSGGVAKISAPMVVGDIQNLPFKDKQFDFVIASHVLEHIPDVAQACRELQRVAKSGYIELPYEGMAKILDLESHIWWCKKQERKLIFTPKQDMQFDTEVYKYARELDRRKTWFPKVVHPNFDISTIQLWWKDSFEFEVNGVPSKSLQAKVQAFEMQNFKPVKTMATTFRKMIIAFLRLVFWHKTRKENFKLEDILQCPSCGRSTFTKNKEAYVCDKCEQKVNLRFAYQEEY